MKEVTKYQADDGKEFDTKAECVRYEKIRAFAEKLGSSSICWYDADTDEVAAWIFENADYVREAIS